MLCFCCALIDLCVFMCLLCLRLFVRMFIVVCVVPFVFCCRVFVFVVFWYSVIVYYMFCVAGIAPRDSVVL